MTKAPTLLADGSTCYQIDMEDLENVVRLHLHKFEKIHAVSLIGWSVKSAGLGTIWEGGDLMGDCQ